MDSPPKLAGETLIVHHIPLVHCQVPDRQCCGGGKRANPFCQPELGAPRAASLPERGLTQADSLLYSSLAEAAEDAGSQARDSAALGVTGRHNPFLPSESEGHDLRSFRLHGSMVTGNPAFQLHDLPPFHLHHAGPPWSVASRSGVVDGQEDRLPSADARRSDGGPCPLASEGMELDECGCPHGSFSFEGGEADWNNSSDESGRHPAAPHSRTCSCSSTEQRPCRFSSTSSQSEGGDHPMGDVSDSSCNSSDGVLVNFSALYNKMHGHSRSNLNSCDSSFCSHADTGAFYLDLQPSPTEPPRPATACGCHGPASPGLDANCNSYHLHSEPCPAESADLTACFQSQARLVVATQNYYKLVTCDLSSQSSPSPAGSSITSCSEEHGRGSPVQPAEYYLFRRPEAKPEESHGECFLAESQGTAAKAAIEGQVYVNVSPPTLGAGRPRSRSYDRNLGRTPAAGLGALERMLSCPVKLSESPALAIPGSPPRRVTSFAELAKGRRKTGASPPLRASGDSSLEFSPIPEFQQDCPGLLEDPARRPHSLPPMPFGHCLNRSCQSYRVEHRLQEGPGACSGRDSGAGGHGGAEQAPLALLMETGASPASGHGQRDVRARADGGSADSQAVVRYSKEQRPTSLPIQPFVFQHHFSRPPKARALHGHLAASLSQLYSAAAARQPAPAAAASAGQPGTLLAQRSADGAASLADGDGKKPGPDGTRPSPLGSYSPVRSSAPFFQSLDSGSPTPERAGDSLPPRSRSCPLSANLLPARASPPRPESPRLVPTKEAPLEQSAQVSEYRLQGDCLPPLTLGGAGVSRGADLAEPQWRGSCEAGSSGVLNSAGARPLNANHLSPQALKWREYRRRNPLALDWQQEPRPARRNPSLEFPGSLSAGRLNGQPVRQLQLGYADLFPEYFSLAEKPPAEFCLSPDGSTESISVDLQQKKGLVKAINTAVDLIVAHFGTSRDPGVKAKLGNSSVSPNVGHLVLKYLCPAVRAVLSDGLKPHVLDLIVGQRRNSPWSVVEASTQLGPSTKVLHALRSKISQLAELSSPGMRLNAFVFGLLNLRALEFWVSHLHSHEDVVLAHYQPVGFLCVAHGLCQALFEELLLLLQPLSLLPFRLDLLFEHHLLQMGQQQRQRKELLRVRQDMLLSAHSTLQLMRSRGSTEPPDGAGEPAGWATGLGASGDGAGQEPRRAKEGAGQEPRRAKEGAGQEPRRAKEGSGQEPRRAKEGAGQEPRRAKEGAGQEPRRAKEGAGQEPRRAKEGAGEEPRRAKEGAELEPRRAKEGAELEPRRAKEGAELEPRRAKEGAGEEPRRAKEGAREEPRRAKEGAGQEPRRAKEGAGQEPRRAKEGAGEEPRRVKEGAELEPRRAKEGAGEERRDRQAGWWYQLMQSSQVYIEGSAAGSKFSRPEKKKKAAPRPGEGGTAPPPREGVVEGAEACPVAEGVAEPGQASDRGWPAWMGSPPDSVLAELKHSKEKEHGAPQGEGPALPPAEDSSSGAPDSSQPIKWGCLFGARKAPKEARQPNRLPSGWLTLDRSVFQLVAQTVGAGMWREPAPEEPPAGGLPPQTPCTVKALCHHIATEAGQLSFTKGAVLRVLARADGDWLRCGLGSQSGLVPLAYVTHLADEDY